IRGNSAVRAAPASGRLLTIAGAGRETLLLARRVRWKTVCARGASLALLGDRSALPLDVCLSAAVYLALRLRYLGIQRVHTTGDATMKGGVVAGAILAMDL